MLSSAAWTGVAKDDGVGVICPVKTVCRKSTSEKFVEHVPSRYELRESAWETVDGDLEIEETESDVWCP